MSRISLKVFPDKRDIAQIIVATIYSTTIIHYAEQHV